MFEYDVFLSHSSVDKPWVIQLKTDLARYGLKAWLDQDEIRPGDIFAQTLEAALDASSAVVLVISPESIASDWVKEEYYRALSLSKRGQRLIPILLRKAEVPGFLSGRDRINFTDEANYANNVWELVWGITGEKPPQVIDLTAPPTTPAMKTPVDRPPTANKPARQSGGVRAGGKIKATNIIAGGGAQIQGADAETARAMLDLAKNWQPNSGGSVEAEGDITADNIVSGGFQYLGQSDTAPALDQFLKELTALREAVAEAIRQNEFTSKYDGPDIQQALQRAAAEAQTPSPPKDEIADQLDRVASLLLRAGEAAAAAGKVGAKVIALAPLAAKLRQLVEVLF